MRDRFTRSTAALVLTFLLAFGGSQSPASAAVTQASGSQSCGVGSHVYVQVELNYGTIEIYRSGTLVATSPYRGLVHHFWGQRNVSWTVKAPNGDIATVADGCTPDPVR